MAIAAGVLCGALGLDPPDADIKYDWLQAEAALTSNAYEDIIDLGRAESVHLIVHYPEGAQRPFPHPRTPGAILTAIPLLAIEFHHLFAVSVAISAFVLVLMVGHLVGWGSPIRTAGVMCLVAVSAPFFTTIRYAGQSAIVAGLTLGAWALFRRGRDLPAGVLLGVAATLKLFPLVLVLPMLMKRRLRPVMATLGVVAVMNGFGVLLPGVGLSDATSALGQGANVWFRLLSNGSLAAGIARFGLDRTPATVLGFVLVLALLAMARRRQGMSWTDDPTMWLGLGLLALPVGWISYDIVLIPALVAAIWSDRRSDRTFALGIWGAWVGVSLGLALVWLWRPGEVLDMGLSTMVLRLLIVLGCVYRIIGSSPESSPEQIPGWKPPAETKVPSGALTCRIEPSHV